MVKKLFISILLLHALSSDAQQIGMYSHYFIKPMVYNPAFTGADDATNVMVVSRSQWLDIRNSPQLNIITANGNFMNDKAGLGIIVVSDKKGLTNRTSGALNYSYKLKFNDETALFLGISMGVINHQINFNNALVENGSDPTLFSNSEQKTTFDANAGFAFIWKGLTFGAAVPQLIGNRINYVDNQNTRAYYTHARHYLGSLGYKFNLSKDKGISITPMGLVRFVPNTPIQYDGSLMFDWQNKFWIGGTYKSDYAVGANAGFCIHKQLYVGYSYDFIIGSIGKYSGTAHELMVNFKFGKNKKKDENPETQQNKPIVTNNPSYDKKIDSLQNKVKENEAKIEELSKKIEQQNETIAKNQQSQINTQSNTSQSSENNQNQNTTAVQSNSSKVQEEGVWLISNEAKDFTDERNKNPEPAFYVVVGTFYYKDLAEAERKRISERGFQAKVIYFSPKQYNYIYIGKYMNKQDAIKKAKELQVSGIKDAWVQLIVE